MLSAARRSLARLSSVVASSARAALSTSVQAAGSTAVAPRHRSNAQELIAKVPVIEVAANVAMCDGGGGATGHPIEYVQLNKRDGDSPTACKYCGLRYIRKAGHHGH